jgi:hypothetical protein
MFFSSMKKEVKAQQGKEEEKRKAEKLQRQQENLIARM